VAVDVIKRWIMAAVGCVATALAVAGAILPGLPTTPFLLVALWAFARSSDALHARLHRIPLLRHALDEAHRFEERRCVRPAVKVFAIAVAWTSVALTAIASGTARPVLLGAVAAAALGGTAFMLWIPSDTE
jgi:uncharacterized membrane protein YbaN (DUF454 family)